MVEVSNPNRRSVLKSMAVAGLVPVASSSARAAPPHTVGDDRLTIVPLDDRPANLYFPAMTAATASVETIFPPSGMIGTFTTPGDSAAVGDWLLSQDDTDGYLVSISMLAYGGLIASRSAAMSEEQARENVKVLRDLSSDNSDAPLFVYDIIQRLAMTHLGGEDSYSSLVREWAILVDRVENLGQEQYREELEEVRAQIPDKVINEYLAARERNHVINRLMIQWAAEGLIDYVVLALDDAAEYGLHRAERVELENLIDELNVADRVQIFFGADEVDATLVARYVQQELNTTASVEVDYSGLEGASWTPPLEGATFNINIASHLEASGAVTEDGNADIALMVNTPSASKVERDADLDAFVSRIAELQQQGQEVIVVDAAYVNRADPALMERLESKVSLPHLLAYSGWNTAGNSLGIATGHGLTRWSFLESGGRGLGVPELVEPTEAHASYLLHRYTLDDYWKNVVQPEAYEKARNMGANPYNLTPDEVKVLEAYVQDELKPYIENYYSKHFDGERITLGHRGNRTFEGTISGLEDIYVELPWSRLFETKLEPKVNINWPTHGH